MGVLSVYVLLYLPRRSIQPHYNRRTPVGGAPPLAPCIQPEIPEYHRHFEYNYTNGDRTLISENMLGGEKKNIRTTVKASPPRDFMAPVRGS